MEIFTPTLLTLCAKGSEQLRTSRDNQRSPFVVPQIHLHPAHLFTLASSRIRQGAPPDKERMLFST